MLIRRFSYLIITLNRYSHPSFTRMTQGEKNHARVSRAVGDWFCS
jgi:hypothetical protein